jgi:hypothetical protein
MSVLKWLIAGVIGAGIGGAAWVLVAYFAEMEVGWIAWGIGLLAGLGVRKSMPADEVNPAAGIAAVAAALLVVAASKYYVVHLVVGDILEPLAAQAEQAEPMMLVADDIAAEREQAGQSVQWQSSNVAGEEILVIPDDIAEEAQQRWEALSESERTEYLESKRVDRDEQMAAVRDEAFIASLGPYDLLWIGLAAMTAFKVGRGAPAPQQPQPTTEPDVAAENPQPPTPPA